MISEALKCNSSLTTLHLSSDDIKDGRELKEGKKSSMENE